MLGRWEQLGKPLFMVPKDFKERIITLSADQDVKLNYLKWLTQALEIDMFEILTVFILYSRSAQQEKLLLLFRLFCYEGETTMQIDEFKFMIDKMSVSLCSTLGIKKVLLLEVVKSSESQMQNRISERTKLTCDEFLSSMKVALETLSSILSDLNGHFTTLGSAVKQDH